jgi:serine/threonine-protein kinase
MPDFHDSETVFSPADVRIGQFIKERYKIVEKLGGGGFGAVYLAHDRELLNRETVIKFLHPEMLANESVRMKFEDEKSALVKLSEMRHPGIGDIYGSGVLPDGTPFMAMQFIRGVSLRKRLEDRKAAGTPLTFSECADILEQLGDALTVAHDLGIIHRDIKPDNLMLVPQKDRAERLVVIDFGIAKLSGAAHTNPGRPATGMMGTVPYAPPEQFMTKPDLGPACDIYSVAAMAFELLTGRYPFPECSLDQFFAQRQQGLRDWASTFRPGLPLNVDALLVGALNYDPKRRPQNARAFCRELATALRQTPIAPRNGVVDPNAETAPILPRETDPVRPPQPLPSTERAVDPKAESDAHIERLKVELEQNRPPQKKILPIALVSGAILLGGGGFLAWRYLPAPSVQKTPPPSPQTQARGFTFAVQVQKMRDGNPYQDPFWGNGREVFENGYKFLLEITPDAAGDLYVFADGKDDSGKPEINLLFPTPKRNDGSPAVTGGQAVQTGQNTFTGSTGNEVVYIVWSSGKQPALDAARKACFENGGTLKPGQAETNLRSFLAAATATGPKVEFVEDEKRPFGKIQGQGETVVYRVELKHR